ncbi:HlyD family secretion protein [Maribacter sp. 2307ULW6-5]|uniref:HlyD family secretion protein n=1 Tax=Maribacter sp. 2307ULW6-5 TaxID=3386275 RepID=UPI0039BC810F
MSEQTAGNLPEKETETVEGKRKKSPVVVLTRTLLVAIVLIFAWHVFSDRHTPYTDQAIVRGLAIPIYPRVSGYVTDMNIKLHSLVQKGDTLFQLDQRPFLLAVKSAEAQLDNAAQMVGARTATVKSAAGRLGMARAQQDRAQRNYDRVQKVLLESPGALSLADKDRAETSLASAAERVSSAQADLERAQLQLGISGEENAQFRAALVALEQAQLNLQFSTVLAPSSGAIESFNVDLGYYSQVGQPLAMFVSSSDYWIEAAMKENNLSNMEVGDAVEFTLDVDPGTIYKGRVSSIGYGVKSGNVSRGQLPAPRANKGWLREPQRFPVIISYDKEQLRTKSRLGGQVDAVVYTNDNFLLNTIAKARIRINSTLSYLR